MQDLRQSVSVETTVIGSLTSRPRVAGELVLNYAVPESEPEDALHITLAAVHGVAYLVTWNLRHIANASVRVLIESVCRDAGFEPPVICTPEELMEP
jgi:hypothetical protein